MKIIKRVLGYTAIISSIICCSLLAWYIIKDNEGIYQLAQAANLSFLVAAWAFWDN